MILWVGHVHRAATVGNGVRGIAEVRVRRVFRLGGRRVKRKLTAFAKIEMFGLRFSWRPGVIRGPGVAAGLKGCGFFHRQSALVVKPVSKPGRFDLLAEINAGIVVKRNVTKRRALAAGPAAVIPWPDHEEVVIFLVGLLEP